VSAGGKTSGERVAPSTEILIGHLESQHVVLRPLSRSHPGLFDHRDGNWIDCEVQISVGGFRASFRADLRSEEFQAFLEEIESLSRTLDGTASFTSMEGQVALFLSGDGKGHIRVDGEAIDAAGSGNRLKFSFELDQTYLPAIGRSLEYLLAAFPVTGSPDA
jgi:carbon monoxide dehydrogenase subunit G